MTKAPFSGGWPDLVKTRYAAPILFASLIALSSSACGSSMKNPDIKQNPHPTQRYDITLRIADAPGPFDSITGYVNYHVTNGECVPLTPISGATLEPQKVVDVALTKIGDGLYKATIYADLFQDADYYGLGVCHWGLVSVGASLNARSLEFSPSMGYEDLLSGLPVNRFFSKRAYRQYSGDHLVDIGNAHRDEFKQDASDTFQTTLTAQRPVP